MMKAVILAAGKSTRTYPLTLTRPKPLLKVANRTIIEHNLDSLDGIASEAIIVVGYKKQMIKDFLGSKYKKIRIMYVEQKEQLGTGHAVLQAEKYVKGRFIVMMGDDVYSRSDIKRCAKSRYSILVTRVKNPESFGVVIERNNILVDIVEKPKELVSDLANAALYVFDRKIFAYLKDLEKTERNEYELPDAIRLLSKKENIFCVKTKKWAPIGYPWDLLKADKELRKGKSVVGKNSKIRGKIDNCSIGNNCTILGNVSSSMVFDNTFIDDESTVQSSVIGNDVYFKGKIIAENAYSVVKDKKIKAGRFGAAIGDSSKLRHVTIKAGCKISPKTRLENIDIKSDI